MSLWGEIAQQQCERIKLLPSHQGRLCSGGVRQDLVQGWQQWGSTEKADIRFAAGRYPLHAGAMQWWFSTLKKSFQPIVCTCCSWCKVTQGHDNTVTFTCFKLNQAWHTLFAKLSKEQNWPKMEGVLRTMLGATMPAFILLFTSHCVARFLRVHLSRGGIREESW